MNNTDTDHLRVANQQLSPAMTSFDAEAVRTADFDIFSYRSRERTIYLDTAATAQKPFAVSQVTRSLMASSYASVHRGTYPIAIAMTKRYENARSSIANFIGAPSQSHIVFTSSATASLNLVAHSYGQLLEPHQAVVVTEMEHHSNLVPWQVLASKGGHELRVWPIEPDGTLSLDRLSELLGDGAVGIVAVTHASNVLGTINPIADICSLAHAKGARVVVDGTQAVTHQRVHVGELDVDFYAFSSHKMYGPTGVGVLYGKQELLERMPPMMTGGEMVDQVTIKQATYQPPPARFEPGTPPFVEAIGMATAAKYLQHHNIDAIAKHERALMEQLWDGLRDIQGIITYGPERSVQRAPVLAFNLGQHHPMDVSAILEESDNICVRVGHHCAMPLMNVLGVKGTLRASLGLYNISTDIERFLAGLRRAASILNG